MHSQDISHWTHEHYYTHGHEKERERRTFWVVSLTSIMMVTEIICGWLFNSKAVFADGWHMGTHTLALAVGLYAYRYARLNAHNPIYTFGAGKVHALGSFLSAVILAMIALFIFGSSAWGLVQPQPIHYNEALLVACLSFIVNSISIWLLHGGQCAAGKEHNHQAHHHDHEHHNHDDHHHLHGHNEQDHTFKAAYTHVIADALTSILAIAALLAAKYLGWAAVDPIVGMVGSLVIAQWAYNLLKNTTSILLDRQSDPKIAAEIRSRIEADGNTKITDLHIWTVAPGKLSAIVSLVADKAKPIEEYKKQIGDLDLAHVTIEVNQCAAH